MSEQADKLDKPADKIAHFEIQGILGAGALGTVYRAWDTKLNRMVALKVLPEHIERPELREHFHMEARAIAALEHPNIVRVLDFADSAAPLQYIALEYLAGLSWGHLLSEHGPATEQVALCVAHDIALALEHAHGQHIVHRDLKPENVIIESDRVVLIDFGAMKLTESNKWIPEGAAQQRKHTVGTIGFMAPEQVAGGKMDHRVDLFSLGALLYKATTSQHPYWVETNDLREIRREANRGHYRDPRDFQPLLTPGFCDLIANLLATNPANRLATSAQARERIANLLAAHGISDPKPLLVKYAAAPGIDQQNDLRTVDTLVRELRLALLRDLYRAIRRQEGDAIRWATSRLRYYSSLFDEAEKFFLLAEGEKPRLLRTIKDRRGLWFAGGVAAATSILVGVATAYPGLFPALHDKLSALLQGNP